MGIASGAVAIAFQGHCCGRAGHYNGVMDDPISWLDAEFWASILRRTVEYFISAAPRVLVVLVATYVFVRLLDVALRAVEKSVTREGDASLADAEHRKRRETLLGIVRKAGMIAIWTIMGMLFLRQIGLDVAPLIAGAGIIGLALGFGAQELVRDVITGFFMLLENQVRVGDVAVVNGTGGLVEHIGLRTIVLRDQSGVVHVFQNGKVSTLSNMTKEWSAMVFDIGVAYKEDTDRVVAVMRDVAAELQQEEAYTSKILEPLEVFGVEQFGDSAVVIKARWKTKPIEQWAVGREYRRRLKKAFDAQRIEIPFPHRTLYWGETSEASAEALRARSAP